MPTIESYQLLLAAAAACEDKKAEDIRILALDPNESGLSDFFLICNGTNDRQNVAITDEIEIRLKREYGVYPNSVEGRRQGEWVLMDYVDFIVHVFSAEKRAYYGLERLRKTAVTVSVDDLSAELKRATATKVKASRGAGIRTGGEAQAGTEVGPKNSATDQAAKPSRAKASKSVPAKTVAKTGKAAKTASAKVAKPAAGAKSISAKQRAPKNTE